MKDINETKQTNNGPPKLPLNILADLERVFSKFSDRELFFIQLGITLSRGKMFDDIDVLDTKGMMVRLLDYLANSGFMNLYEQGKPFLGDCFGKLRAMVNEQRLEEIKSSVVN